MEKTFKDKLLEGLDKALKFSKKNYLSFVVILLTILIFVFLVLPAATVNVTNLAYASNQENLEAVVEKLVGRSEFKGKNPVDPFCGKWDTRL